MTNKTTPTDDLAELQAMADYYAKEYAEVYFVRDLQANVIVAVEAFPARPNRPAVKRNGRVLNCFNYKQRLLSSRERFDLAPTGKPMVGYESIFGNDTRLGDTENGVVPTSNANNETLASAEFGISSPFEEAKIRAEVQKNETTADYELKTKDNGKTVERFETFAVERVK